ncbi:MAG: hypothetical protein KBD63_03665 [Bacteriovoracaceae bacterium]|nr:hypothetical protein [Bacteriovoracaceae bacterium]
MNAIHLHLILNHFPTIGMIFAIILMTVAFIAKKEFLKKTALFTIIASSLFIVPVYLTGERAEDLLEERENSEESHLFIEKHEEAVELAIWLVGLTALLALTTLGVALSKQKEVSQIFLMITYLFTFATAGVLARASYLGGMISHTELRVSEFNDDPEAGVGVSEDSEELKAIDDKIEKNLED